MASNIIESKNRIQRLTELGMNFIDNQVELTKLSLAEWAVKSSSKILSIVIIGVFSSVVILFLSIGAAIWIGVLRGNLAMGFFIVALFYAVLMLLFLLFIRPLISNQITQFIINSLDNENERD